MAGSLDVALTTIQNGVTAVNNLGSRIGASDIATPYVVYTPLITPATGTFTTASATGRFKMVGSTVFVSFVVTITTNGTAAGYIQVSLPVVSDGDYVLVGRDNVITGKILQFLTVGATGFLFFYDNTYPGANGASLAISGTYGAL